MSTDSTQKTLIFILKLLVGLLFIFSGLIKLNDPLGFSYKLEEYFEVFHITFLNPFSVGISILICASEVILGAFLLFAYQTKKVLVALLAMIIFFTFLTFYSAYFEVVKTCGCFGDAIPLTPWTSFIKDLLLLTAISFLFYQRKHLPTQSTSNTLTVGTGALTFLFGIYTYTFLPIIDFLPYKVGANIPQLMKLPPNAKLDEYEILYTLKSLKSGESKQVTDKEYLKAKLYEDKNWQLMNSSTPKLIKKGDEAVIKDLNIYDANAVSYTREIIENPYYNFVVVAYNLNKSSLNAIGDINALAINANQDFNIRTVLLTSNSAIDAANFAKKNHLAMDIFYADAVPLKSMVRSNPGLLLLKNGVIVDKWPSSNLPSSDELNKKYFSKN